MARKDRVQPREILLVLAAAGFLVWQVLLPGFIGLANNGDFLKVSGRSCIGTADPEAFVYFQPDYSRDPRFCVSFGPSSSESLILRIASAVEQRAGDPKHFDIRWLGALHLLGWLAGFFLLLRALRPLRGAEWWIAAALSAWIFLDAGYISYLNSFYMDTAALIGGLAVIPAAWMFASGSLPARAAAAIAAAAGLLLVASKGQHALLAIPLAGFFLLIHWKFAEKLYGRNSWIAAAGVAALLGMGAAWAGWRTPPEYKAKSRFNVIFFKLLPLSPAPARDLAELDLPAGDLKYIGMHAFLPQAPLSDPVWLSAFSQQGGYANLLKFYLRRPEETIWILWRDLKEEGWQRRSLNFSNYRKQDGHPAGAKSNRMASWSALRSWIFKRWPSHAIFLYAMLLPLAFWRARKETEPFRLAISWTVLLVLAMGCIEFGVASLCDAIETNRHLLMFHMFTDFALLLVVVYALDCIPVSISRRAPDRG